MNSSSKLIIKPLKKNLICNKYKSYIENQQKKSVVYLKKTDLYNSYENSLIRNNSNNNIHDHMKYRINLLNSYYNYLQSVKKKNTSNQLLSNDKIKTNSKRILFDVIKKFKNTKDKNSEFTNRNYMKLKNPLNKSAPIFSEGQFDSKNKNKKLSEKNQYVLKTLKVIEKQKINLETQSNIYKMEYMKKMIRKHFLDNFENLKDYFLEIKSNKNSNYITLDDLIYYLKEVLKIDIDKKEIRYLFNVTGLVKVDYFNFKYIFFPEKINNKLNLQLKNNLYITREKPNLNSSNNRYTSNDKIDANKKRYTSIPNIHNASNIVSDKIMMNRINNITNSINNDVNKEDIKEDMSNIKDKIKKIKTKKILKNIINIKDILFLYKNLYNKNFINFDKINKSFNNDTDINLIKKKINNNKNNYNNKNNNNNNNKNNINNNSKNNSNNNNNNNSYNNNNTNSNNISISNSNIVRITLIRNKSEINIRINNNKNTNKDVNKDININNNINKDLGKDINNNNNINKDLSKDINNNNNNNNNISKDVGIDINNNNNNINKDVGKEINNNINENINKNINKNINNGKPFHINTFIKNIIKNGGLNPLSDNYNKNENAKSIEKKNIKNIFIQTNNNNKISDTFFISNKQKNKTLNVEKEHKSPSKEIIIQPTLNNPKLFFINGKTKNLWENEKPNISIESQNKEKNLDIIGIL